MEASADLGVVCAGFAPAEHPAFERAQHRRRRFDGAGWPGHISKDHQSSDHLRAPFEPTGDLGVVVTLGRQAEDTPFDRAMVHDNPELTSIEVAMTMMVVGMATIELLA